MRIILAIAGLFLLGGCQTQPIGSVMKGECQLVRTPTYQVLGKTTYDQGWIDDTTEGLVRGCKQQRPKKRPAALGAAQATPKPAPVKLKWWQRQK